MEGLLRTSRDDDQLLVLESGVQEMILDRIMAEGFHCVGELQASFDLLGELVRFSVPAYCRLVAHLGHVKVWRVRYFRGRRRARLLTLVAPDALVGGPR